MGNSISKRYFFKKIIKRSNSPKSSSCTKLLSGAVVGDSGGCFGKTQPLGLSKAQATQVFFAAFVLTKSKAIKCLAKLWVAARGLIERHSRFGVLLLPVIGVAQIVPGQRVVLIELRGFFKILNGLRNLIQQGIHLPAVEVDVGGVGRELGGPPVIGQGRIEVILRGKKEGPG